MPARCRKFAIYRAPDLGTTGSLPVAQVLTALRAQGVIGVDTRDIKQVTVTRLARTVDSKEIERAVAQAIEHRGGLGDAANISLTFDRDVADLRLDAANTGAMLATSARYEPRNGRFDVTFQIANDNGNPTQLRFTGSAIETVEVAVLTRNVERTDILKSADVIVERRPRAEVGSDAAAREQARRHADAPLDARRPADARRRSGQARPRAARPGRHPDLPDRRTFI